MSINNIEICMPSVTIQCASLKDKFHETAIISMTEDFCPLKNQKQQLPNLLQEDFDTGIV